MANHWQSMIVLLPAIIIYMYYEKPHIDLHMAVNALLLFVLGTTVYLFVIIRSSAIPAYAWGEIKNLQDLFWLISLKHYIPELFFDFVSKTRRSCVQLPALRLTLS
jgi:hypothetical protein